MPEDIFTIYSHLPEYLKNKASEPERMQALEEIEKKYSLSLAEYIIRILIGDINRDKLPDVLMNERKISLDNAQKISQELKQKVYGGICDEFGVGQESQEKLLREYNSFINSSLYQNILASEEMLTEKFARVGLDLIIKDEFYAAVNAGDKIKAVGVLRVLCKKGKLGSSFQNDKRYLDFWAGFLERHYGVGVKEKFLQNPSEKKYLVEFLRFILEKRLNFNLEESAMIGVGLAELCRESGESEFAEMAYGDEEKGKFMWSE